MIDKQKDNTTMTRADVWVETYHAVLKGGTVDFHIDVADAADRCLEHFDKRFELVNSNSEAN